MHLKLLGDAYQSVNMLVTVITSVQRIAETYLLLDKPVLILKERAGVAGYIEWKIMGKLQDNRTRPTLRKENMSKSVITMTKTVQRLQDQLAIAWDRVTKAERETIEKDEQLAEAKQWKDISIHQGLKIKALEAEIAELRERMKSRRGVDEFGGD